MRKLPLVEIIDAIKRLRSSDKNMDVRCRALEDLWSIGKEPEVPCSGMTSPLSPFIFYAAEIVSVEE